MLCSSAVDGAHLLLVEAFARGGAPRQRPRCARDPLRLARPPTPSRSPPGARDAWCRGWGRCRRPAQADTRGPAGPRDRALLVGHLQVLLEVLLGEAWEAGDAGVALGQVLHASPPTREEPASQGRVRDEPDAQLPARGQDLLLLLHVAREKSEYSVCNALIGYNACARRIVSGAASDSPRYRTFPAFTNSFIAPTVSSIGISESTRCW